MKKLYEMPKLELIAFEEDIITSSLGGENGVDEFDENKGGIFS